MKRKNMHLGAKPSLFKNAYQLRKNQTEAEEILWKHLRDRQMEGIRFRRQHPLDKYVPDFYAHEIKLAIELDGAYHQDRAQKFYDLDRENNLIIQGLSVLRFTNEDIMLRLEESLEIIRNRIVELKSKKLTS